MRFEPERKIIFEIILKKKKEKKSIIGNKTHECKEISQNTLNNLIPLNHKQNTKLYQTKERVSWSE